LGSKQNAESSQENLSQASKSVLLKETLAPSDSKILLR